MSTKEIGVSRDGAVTRIHINRPAKRNAITAAMYAAMADAIAQAEADGGAAVIISGEGSTFCAGNDLADFVGSRPETEAAPVHQFLRAIATTPIILIAAVQGRAIGIGTTMLLHCDYVVAETDAVLQMPFVDLALVPEAASSLLVPRLVGHRRAAELLLLGEPIDAQRAERLGFVNQVVATGQGLAEAQAAAVRFAAKPASALRRTKQLLKSSSQDVLGRMEEENRAFAAQLQTPELAATVARFFAARAGKAA
jgi:enoyl-CoA hydratase/carnithine racemase